MVGLTDDTCIWLLVPIKERPEEATITWTSYRINGTDKETLVERASKKLVSDEQLIIGWSPARLKMELDRFLWRDAPHLSVRRLWEYICTYLYLPRLANEDVLLNAISDGLRSQDYFGYADRVEEDGKYLGLIFGKGRSTINNDGQSVLVRPEAAKKQMEVEKPIIIYAPGETPPVIPPEVPPPQPPTPPSTPKMRRFYGSVELDSKRAGRDAGNIAESVIQYLKLEKGADVKVTVEIVADMPEGAGERTIRTVSENCRTLKFKQFGFEEE